MRVACIGLGGMGAPIAAHIAGAGHAVTVFNRTPARAEAWLARHVGTAAASPAAAARDAELALICVTDDEAFDAVMDGRDGLLAGLPRGAVVIDHGSGRPDRARARAEAAAKLGLGFLDAPVTGGQRGAEAGSLSVMVGGPEAQLARVEPVMRAYASEVMRMGDVGAGHLTKLVNVIIGTGTGLAVAEGLGFAIRAGLDPARVREILLKGSSNSWQLQHRGGAMLERDYRPLYAVTLGLKDVGNAILAGETVDAPLPLMRLAAEIYGELARSRGGALDVASVLEYFAPRAE